MFYTYPNRGRAEGQHLVQYIEQQFNSACITASALLGWIPGGPRPSSVMARPKESPSIAVERALSMLELIEQRPSGLSNSELSRRLKIPKSSASYILRVLERRGYLMRDAESGKYRLGLRVLSLSQAVQLGKDIRSVALPVMRQLTQSTELTCHLAILDRGEAVYVEKVEAPGFIKMDTWVGRRMRVNTTSVGKAQVAYLTKDELEDILREHGLEAATPLSITSRERFYKELARVRAQGYAVDDEENNPGVRCIAAPVFGSRGQIAGAVGVSAATSQITKARLPKVAVVVKAAARRISEQLGSPKRIHP